MILQTGILVDSQRLAMWRSAFTPIALSFVMVAAAVFTAMTIVIRLADRDAITLGQGIAVFATFITGGLVITAAVWLSWSLAR
jgi:hypothetical protein